MSTQQQHHHAIGYLVTEDLLSQLDELFPEQCPHFQTSLPEIMYTSGQRAVVNFLRTKFNEANQNILENPSHVYA